MASKVNLTNAIEMSRIAKRIGRSVMYTVCDGHTFANGEPNDFTDTLIGKWTAKRATRFLRHEHGDDTITIVHTMVYKQYCDMSLLDFWLNARATSEPELTNEFYINN